MSPGGAGGTRSSSATLSPYRPRYSEPSASIAPYGPTEAATSSGRVMPFALASTAASTANSVLRDISSAARSRRIRRLAKPSKVAW